MDKVVLGIREQRVAQLESSATPEVAVIARPMAVLAFASGD
jgi:hypothetical protein